MKIFTPRTTTMMVASLISLTALSANAQPTKKNPFDPTVLTADDSDTINHAHPKKTTNSQTLDKSGKRYTTVESAEYINAVNNAVWTPQMKANSAMTVKIQTLLDRHHASVGAIDGGWGTHSKNALANFQRMKNLPATGKMNQETWEALSHNSKDILVSYTITPEDVTTFNALPKDTEAQSKLSELGYESIQEKLAERFHMRIDYLTKINPNKKFIAGETITVVDTGSVFENGFTKVVINKATNTLTAYQDQTLVASYPATIGNTKKSVNTGTYTISNKVKMPHYKATITKNNKKETAILPPGANNPVGVVWIGLNKSGYGIHGVSNPEIIGQLSSTGSVGLSNWDALEVFANVDENTAIEIH